MIFRFIIGLLYVPIRCTARSREKLAAYVLASLQMYSKNDKLLPPLPRSIRFLPFSFPHTLLSCPLSRSTYIINSIDVCLIQFSSLAICWDLLLTFGLEHLELALFLLLFVSPRITAAFRICCRGNQALLYT